MPGSRQALVEALVGRLIRDQTIGQLTAVVELRDSTIPAEFPFYLAVEESTERFEVQKVTAAAGQTLTVERGQLGTVAVAHELGAAVVLNLNRQDITRLLARLEQPVGGGGGGTPADSVVAETSYGQASGVGVGTDYAREDHTHGTPAVPAHAALSGVTADQHHAQSHAIDGADHSGTLAHTALGSVTADQHHAQAHSDADHTSASRVTVRKNTGADVGTRPRLNLIEGANVTLTVADDAGSGEVDVTIASTGGGGGTTPADTVVAETSYGQSTAVGVSTTEHAREDHSHGTPGLASTGPSASAVGDTQALGAGTLPAKDDHRHAREAFAAPVASAVGDTQDAGAAATVPRSDHRHAREAFGTTQSGTAYGTAFSGGSASTVARGDHQHGTVARQPQTVTFSKAGAQTVQTGTLRWYANRAITIVSVRASVGTQPTGASLIVDVNKNGTTIFTTQANRPTIAVSTNTDLSGTPDVTTLAQGDYLTVDVDQIGSTVAGSDLTVEIEYTVD